MEAEKERIDDECLAQRKNVHNIDMGEIMNEIESYGEEVGYDDEILDDTAYQMYNEPNWREMNSMQLFSFLADLKHKALLFRWFRQNN